MKKITFYILIVFLPILNLSCTDIEKQIQGLWQVDQAYVHKEPLDWDLLNNAIALNKDKSCFLPLFDLEHRKKEENGTWEVYKESDKIYLEIKTGNIIFNKKFEVTDIKIKTFPVDGELFYKMSLKADSITFECSRVL